VGDRRSRLRRADVWDIYARLLPRRLLRVLTYPLGRQLKTEDSFLHESARMLNDAFAFIANERIQGDYFEFGVYRGRTFVEAWFAAKRYGLPLRLHAFDSFAGLPGAEGTFSTGEYTAPRAAFERVLRANRIPHERVTITQGFFGNSLADDPLPEIAAALAWIDCDIYESTVPVLKYLTGKLTDGSVLVFDDWFCHHSRSDRGEQRACREWLEQNAAISLVPYRSFHWAGQSFIVNR
jgi:O-methyltransferase